VKKQKRPRLKESWDASVEQFFPQLLNSNLGSVPNFVNSFCVPLGGTAVVFVVLIVFFLVWLLAKEDIGRYRPIRRG